MYFYFSDKMLLHTIVVALSCGNFSLNLSVMASDLRVTITMLSALSKETGCSIKKEGSASFAQLKAPLKFPVRKLGAGGKKK